MISPSHNLSPIISHFDLFIPLYNNFVWVKYRLLYTRLELDYAGSLAALEKLSSLCSMLEQTRDQRKNSVDELQSKLKQIHEFAQVAVSFPLSPLSPLSLSYYHNAEGVHRKRIINDIILIIDDVIIVVKWNFTILYQG